MQKMVPGTVLKFENGSSMFAMFRPLIKATDGLTLSQVCAITGLEPYTVQNWVKRGFVSRPVEKKYRERQLARILLISSLRDCMQLERIGELMAMINGDANDTGDDIISEEQMYDYLCEIIGKSGESTIGISEIPIMVSEVTKDYVPPTKTAAERLNTALNIMVLAYTAGKYKQQADSLFMQMKEKKIYGKEKT